MGMVGLLTCCASPASFFVHDIAYVYMYRDKLLLAIIMLRGKLTVWRGERVVVRDII